MPEQLDAFIRTWIAPPPPVAKKPAPRYNAWTPTKENPECPF